MPPILAGPSPCLQYWGFCACLNGWVRAQVQSTEIPPEGGTQASMGSLSSPGMDAVILSRPHRAWENNQPFWILPAQLIFTATTKGFLRELYPTKAMGSPVSLHLPQLGWVVLGKRQQHPEMEDLGTRAQSCVQKSIGQGGTVVTGDPMHDLFLLPTSEDMLINLGAGTV